MIVVSVFSYPRLKVLSSYDLGIFPVIEEAPSMPPGSIKRKFVSHNGAKIECQVAGQGAPVVVINAGSSA